MPRQDLATVKPGSLLFPTRHGSKHDKGLSQNPRLREAEDLARSARKDPSQNLRMFQSSSKHSDWPVWTIKYLFKTGRLKTSQVSEPRDPLNLAEIPPASQDCLGQCLESKQLTQQVFAQHVILAPGHSRFDSLPTRNGLLRRADTPGGGPSGEREVGYPVRPKYGGL
ncbi:hypothetical protein B0H14DRAFT_2556769 [Mycena olivaceomarginata]|nr:hypothetical protein B0H14DRAFT_2556769 [Mycena olivaceomarginata]